MSFCRYYNQFVRQKTISQYHNIKRKSMRKWRLGSECHKYFDDVYILCSFNLYFIRVYCGPRLLKHCSSRKKTNRDHSNIFIQHYVPSKWQTATTRYNKENIVSFLCHQKIYFFALLSQLFSQIINIISLKWREYEWQKIFLKPF